MLDITIAQTMSSPAMAQQEVKIAILARSNAEFFLASLKQAMYTTVPDITFKFYLIPFYEYSLQILDSHSALHQFNADFTIFFDFLEDWFDPYFHEEFDYHNLKNNLNEQANLIQVYANKNGGEILVNRLINLVSLIQIIPYYAFINYESILDYANQLYQENFKDSKINIINIGHLIKTFEGAKIDTRLKLLARIPFSQEFGNYLSEQYAGYIAQFLGKSIRLIVVDLDNTLWGGVLGEDQIQGIKIGGDYPGNCYAGFQKGLKALSNRGIPLAIVSKNNFDVVEKAFIELSMPLNLNDFVAHRINWLNKAENIQSIAQELNLGLQNILFIDDSKVECAFVKNLLPQVHVMTLPEDPSYYLQTLNSMHLLNYLKASNEDLRRSISYQERRKWQEQKTKALDPVQFYQKLELNIFLYTLSTQNINRLSELFNKTNQFNLTGIKYSSSELLNLQQGGELVIAIGIKDRYCELEIMGGIVLLNTESAWCIENYVISCRALGKTAEIEALKAILDQICRHSPKTILGKLIPTDKNIPAQGVYKELGFNPEDNYLWNLKQPDPAILQAASSISIHSDALEEYFLTDYPVKTQ